MPATPLRKRAFNPEDTVDLDSFASVKQSKQQRLQSGSEPFGQAMHAKPASDLPTEFPTVFPPVALTGVADLDPDEPVVESGGLFSQCFPRDKLSSPCSFDSFGETDTVSTDSDIDATQSLQLKDVGHEPPCFDEEATLQFGPDKDVLTDAPEQAAEEEMQHLAPVEEAPEQAGVDLFAKARTTTCKKQDEQLERTVQRACQIHADILALYRKNSRLFADDKEEDDDLGVGAREVAEQQGAELYDELWDILLFLLPWVRERYIFQDLPEGRYTVAQFRGREVKRKGKASEDLETPEKMLLARKRSKFGRAREALCAVLATLSTRKEMSWLDAYDVEDPVRGYFAHGLVDPSCTFRLSFAMDGGHGRPRPASLLVLNEHPLAEALSKMDQCGPLKVDDPRAWCQKAGRQFAFQEIVPGVPMTSRKSVQSSKDLKPEPKIRALLRTRTDVLLLDSYVALAPRELARKSGISEVVKAELETLLRDAKAKGRAVVFQLGGTLPHVLAEKVYLQPRFAQYGLRCGYLRCRASPSEPWEKQKSWDGRACIGLQLP